MLSVLSGIHGVRINDIIHFLSNKGKNVYVIDVYRTPVERKMSEYFEKLSPYHFNNSEDNISKYIQSNA
jgi:DNA-binding LytR/AlgR family response regulator